MINTDSPFDMWEILGVRCAGYDSELDEDMIGALVAISEGVFCSDFAAKRSIPTRYAELLYSIACSAGLAEYGTSPRGAFPKDKKALDIFIERCDEWFKERWSK